MASPGYSKLDPLLLRSAQAAPPSVCFAKGRPGFVPFLEHAHGTRSLDFLRSCPVCRSVDASTTGNAVSTVYTVLKCQHIQQYATLSAGLIWPQKHPISWPLTTVICFRMPNSQWLSHHVASEPCESIHPLDRPHGAMEIGCDIIGLVPCAEVDNIEFALSFYASTITISHGRGMEEGMVTRNVSERKYINLRFVNKEGVGPLR
jgi:hypothetical protein